jgi:hypothetical protein
MNAAALAVARETRSLAVMKAPVGRFAVAAGFGVAAFGALFGAATNYLLIRAQASQHCNPRSVIFTSGCAGPAPDYTCAYRGFRSSLRQMEGQCDATIQATTIRPDTSTIVRPWVSSHRRAWRRVLRM